MHCIITDFILCNRYKICGSYSVYDLQLFNIIPGFRLLRILFCRGGGAGVREVGLLALIFYFHRSKHLYQNLVDLAAGEKMFHV